MSGNTARLIGEGFLDAGGASIPGAVLANKVLEKVDPLDIFGDMLGIGNGPSYEEREAARMVTQRQQFEDLGGAEALPFSGFDFTQNLIQADNPEFRVDGDYTTPPPGDDALDNILRTVDQILLDKPTSSSPASTPAPAATPAAAPAQAAPQGVISDAQAPSIEEVPSAGDLVGGDSKPATGQGTGVEATGDSVGEGKAPAETEPEAEEEDSKSGLGSTALNAAAAALSLLGMQKGFTPGGDIGGLPGTSQRSADERRVISRSSFDAGGVQGLGISREYGFVPGKAVVPRQAASALLGEKKKGKSGVEIALNARR